jgi:hypothetical protein
MTTVHVHEDHRNLYHKWMIGGATAIYRRVKPLERTWSALSEVRWRVSAGTFGYNSLGSSATLPVR